MLTRAYKFSQRANAGKVRKLRDLAKKWRKAAGHVKDVQWRVFFEKGSFNKYLSVSEYDGDIVGMVGGTSKMQAVAHQTVGTLKSWIGGPKHRFSCIVEGSSLDSEIRHQLHVINRLEAWFEGEDIEMNDSGETIPDRVRKLGRIVFKRAMSEISRPNLSKIHPMLDQRMVGFEVSENSKKFPFWVHLSTAKKRETADIPLRGNSYFRQQGGETKNSLQLISKDDELSFRIYKEHDYSEQRETYTPQTEVLGLDFGLRNLFASSEGDLFGRNFIDGLKYYDRRINGLAAYRQTHGLDVSSKKYDERVEAFKGFLKTTVNRVLNRIVDIHKPARIVLEDLDFQHPSLSRRMNRLLQWCGRGILQDKLDALEEEYGIQHEEVAAHYTSQSCSSCGYPDPKNRDGEAFECRFCGFHSHADVNAASNVASRRSWGVDGEQVTRSVILSEQLRLFGERPLGATQEPGSHGDPVDLVSENPYCGGSLRKEVMSKWNDLASST